MTSDLATLPEDQFALMDDLVVPCTSVVVPSLPPKAEVPPYCARTARWIAFLSHRGYALEPSFWCGPCRDRLDIEITLTRFDIRWERLA